MTSYELGITMALLASFSWALAAVFYRKALTRITNPLVTNFLRTPLAIIVLLIISVCMGSYNLLITSLSQLDVALSLLIATIVMNIIGDTLYLVSIRNVGVSVAYPVSYSYPILVAILALIFLREEIYPTLIIGTIIALTGVWLISQNISEESENIREYSFVLGIIAALGAATSWSIGIILFRVLVGSINTVIVGIIKLLFLLILSSPAVLTNVNYIKNEVNNRILLFALVGGLFGVGVGDWFFYISLYNLGAAIAAALTTSSPLLSLILAFLILHEKITKKRFVGTILIILGVILISLKY